MKLWWDRISIITFVPILEQKLNYLFQMEKSVPITTNDCMVVGFTITYVISAYHHWCELELCIWHGLLDTTLCDKVCQWLATGRWFSPGTLFPPPIKLTERYNWNIVESGVKHQNANPKQK